MSSPVSALMLGQCLIGYHADACQVGVGCTDVNQCWYLLTATDCSAAAWCFVHYKFFRFRLVLSVNTDSDSVKLGVVTALFTKPPAGGWNNLQGSFQPPAHFKAYGSFRNCTRQNHGTTGNPEASSSVNSTVRPLQRYSQSRRQSRSQLCLVQFLKNPEAVNRGMVSEVVPATGRRLCE